MTTTQKPMTPAEMLETAEADIGRIYELLDATDLTDDEYTHAMRDLKLAVQRRDAARLLGAL